MFAIRHFSRAGRPCGRQHSPARGFSLSAALGFVLAGPVLTGPVLTGPVLAGPVLTGPVLAGPVFAGPVFAGPVLAGSVVTGAVLTGSAEFAQRAAAQIVPAVQTPRVTRAFPSGVGGSRTAPLPAVEDCGQGKSQIRPKSLILACGDGNDLAKDLVWSKWGTTAAYATGVDTWNACVPYCAASKTWYSTTADFTLTKPVHTTKGWLFEHLTVNITGHTRQKLEKVITFSEAPVSNA